MIFPWGGIKLSGFSEYLCVADTLQALFFRLFYFVRRLAAGLRYLFSCNGLFFTWSCRSKIFSDRVNTALNRGNSGSFYGSRLVESASRFFSTYLWQVDDFTTESELAACNFQPPGSINMKFSAAIKNRDAQAKAWQPGKR